MSDGQSAPHPLWAALYFTLCWSTVDFSTYDSLSLLTIDVYMQPLTVTKCTCCKCANISQLNTCTPDSTKTVIHNQRYCDLYEVLLENVLFFTTIISWFLVSERMIDEEVTGVDLGFFERDFDQWETQSRQFPSKIGGSV